ncbi:MAG: CpsB/CapC family capsule biosynthesis tyrosine phosphatase [Desulfatiglandaceae bacterium]
MKKEFKFLIDVHSHILPGIDDGPETLEESLILAKIYARSGFRTVVATPHCIPGTGWMPNVQKIREKIELVSAGLRNYGILLCINPGMEIAMDPLVPQLLSEGRVLTISDGPYLLLECPFQRFPLGWEDILHDISRMGYRVLLAHPERCAQLAAEPELVKDIASSSAYIQINWESLLGLNGRHARKVALAFAAERKIHCVATDSHDSELRSPEMVTRGLEAMISLLGERNLNRLMIENPHRVLKAEKLEDLDGIAGISGSAHVRRKWFQLS